MGSSTEWCDTLYLDAMQDRDMEERYSNLALMLADTYSLTQQVMQYQEHFNS